MQKLLLVIAAFFGILIAYVDSRPTWDDAGITAFALLVSAAIIGLFVQRRPWLYGIAIGVFIPVVAILRKHDFWMLAVMVIPLVGVYAGRASRRLFDLQGVLKPRKRRNNGA